MSPPGPLVDHVVDKDVVDRDEAALVCAAALRVMGPRITQVHIDAFTDFESELPDEARLVQDELRAHWAEHGPRRAGEGMAVELDPRVPQQLRWVQVYAPWSIHVQLIGDDTWDLGSFHDCGHSVVLALTAGEAEELGRALADVAPVVPLASVHARRRHTRRARWRARLARFRP